MSNFKPEDPRNVNFFAQAKAPDPRLAEMPAEDFVNRYVQLGFVGTDPHGVARTEYMWGLITKTENGEPHGIVENDPVLDGVPAFGESVLAPRARLVQVMPPFTENN